MSRQRKNPVPGHFLKKGLLIIEYILYRRRISGRDSASEEVTFPADSLSSSMKLIEPPEILKVQVPFTL